MREFAVALSGLIAGADQSGGCALRAGPRLLSPGPTTATIRGEVPPRIIKLALMGVSPGGGE